MRSICAVVFCFLTGCSFSSQKKLVACDNGYVGSANISNKIEIVRKADGSTDYLWQAEGRVEQGKSCRVKYHNLWQTARFMVVEGQIEGSGKKYPVVLDTGATQAVFIKNVHIRENGLHLQPVRGQMAQLVTGICDNAKVKVGDVKFIDWPTFCIRGRMGLSLFGLTVREDDSIILGLPALRMFKYIVFDGVDKEVEFSSQESFEPQNPVAWSRYPMTVEEDLHGNAFLFVQIPIEGQTVELQLDTGSGNGLSVSEEVWNQIRPEKANVKLRKGEEYYPYIGTAKCSKAVVENLSVGDRIVKGATISVLPEGNSVLEECGGLVGMQYFSDTEIVLDFEGSFLWVKK